MRSDGQPLMEEGASVGLEAADNASASLDRAEAAVRSLLRRLGPVLVAFSGGVDSALVLRLALDELGRGNVLAVTASGDVHTPMEVTAAAELAAWLDARHLVMTTHELTIEGFAENPPERCYLCKKAMYTALLALADGEGLRAVVDGSNADDGGDYRPGTAAATELGVRSPLAEAGIGKQQVRDLARSLGLPNWDLPSAPCLASRFPYGEVITPVKLEVVAAAERGLQGLGFTQVRVRHHGRLARLEVAQQDIAHAAEESVRRAIVKLLRDLGYAYVALDLEGFRSGSLNEVLRPAAAFEEDA